MQQQLGMVNIQEELIKLCWIFAWHYDHAAAAAKSAPVALIKERVAASSQASAMLDPALMGQEDCEDATSELLAAVGVGVDTVASLCAVGTPTAVGAASATYAVL